jgi:hypothetical protein
MANTKYWHTVIHKTTGCNHNWWRQMAGALFLWLSIFAWSMNLWSKKLLEAWMKLNDINQRHHRHALARARSLNKCAAGQRRHATEEVVPTTFDLQAWIWWSPSQNRDPCGGPPLMSNQGNMSEGERKRSCVAVQLIRVAASRWLLSTRALASSLCSTLPPP